MILDPEIDNYEASAKGLTQPALAPNTIYNLPEQEDTNESPDLTEGTCTLQKDVSTLHTNLFSENKYQISKGQQSLSHILKKNNRIAHLVAKPPLYRVEGLSPVAEICYLLLIKNFSARN